MRTAQTATHRCRSVLREVYCACLMLLFDTSSALSADSASVAQAFTVRDSIQMRRILSVEGSVRIGAGDTVALYSPNGRHVVVRVRRGDIERDENVDELLLWQTDELNQALASSAAGQPAPAPKRLVEYRFHDDAMELSSLQWLSDRELGFIARGANGRRQAFGVDIDSGKQTPITHSATDVASFSVAGDTVVYFARRARPGTKTVLELAGAQLPTLLNVHVEDTSEDPVELFVMSGDIATPRPIQVPATYLRDHRIWIAPQGRYAITLAPAINAPLHWSAYRGYDPVRTGWTPDRVVSDPTSPDLIDRLRYQLVDLHSGQARALFDAPDGSLTYTRTPHAVFWRKDGRHVIVAHTFLPLTGVSSAERQRRADNPAIAEVDIRTGEARAIVREPFATQSELLSGRRSDQVIGVDWDPEKETLNIYRQLADRSQVTEAYRARDRSWKKIRPSTTMPVGPNSTITYKESASLRPTLHVSDAQGRSQLLYDPAPQLESFSFGRREALTWTDPHGRRWRGGLIYPVNYQAGKRYPLVLQTHGYSDTEFLFDGPAAVTTAFAAQPLANAGFAVLQAAEAPEAITDDDREGENVAIGWKAAIDQLTARGLIDPQRVGVIGWSRTGYHVAATMAKYPDLLRAATISDSVQYNYTQQLMAAGNRHATSDFQKVTGGTPHDAGYGHWFDRNIFYRMSRSDTALRVEAIALGSLMSMWETHALHLQAGKPVDLVYFPEGSHNLLKPSERLGSQQGNVDWFRFWLQNYEDPDPGKHDQYKRWRVYIGRTPPTH